MLPFGPLLALGGILVALREVWIHAHRLRA